MIVVVAASKENNHALDSLNFEHLVSQDAL